MSTAARGRAGVGTAARAVLACTTRGKAATAARTSAITRAARQLRAELDALLERVRLRLLLRRLLYERIAACYAIGDALVRGNDEHVTTGRDQVLKLEELVATIAGRLAPHDGRGERWPQVSMVQQVDAAASDWDEPTVPNVVCR